MYYFNQKKLMHVWADDTPSNNSGDYYKSLVPLSGDYLEPLPSKDKNEPKNFSHKTAKHILSMRADILMSMGFIEEELGRTDEAIEHWFQAYITRIHAVGHDHPDTIQSRKTLIEKAPRFFETISIYNCLTASKQHEGDIFHIPYSRPEDKESLITRYKGGSLIGHSKQDIIGEPTEEIGEESVVMGKLADSSNEEL